MTNIITAKLFSKDYDWWIEFEDGTQRKVYWKRFFNSSDWIVNFKGKKYFVNLDTTNMTATINLESEYK